MRIHIVGVIALLILITLAILSLDGFSVIGRAPLSETVSTADAAKTQSERNDIWPKPVDEFLKGQYLQRADVVLTRRDGDITSYMIRWATNSPFSHAAMIFTGPQFDTGVSGTFVIEATSSGVDLTNLYDYLNDKSSFIAIKRFKGNWFDEAKKARVRGVLLDKIKSEYNYWVIGRIIKNIWFGVQNKVQGKEQTVESYRERSWTPPNDYICSGLVQLGFVEAVLEYIRSGILPPSALKQVVFHEEAASRLPDATDWAYFDAETAVSTADIFRRQNLYELESVTPQDLAESDKLEWLYFIRNGQVHRISSYGELNRKLF